MTEGKLLVYGLEDSQNYFVTLYFDINQVQGFFITENEFISILLSGQIYELQYNKNILTELQNCLKLKKLGVN